MTNYTKTTDFAAKDALPSGNSAKIVKGSEIDTEFNNIATASATKANANSAALTGTTTFETISDGTIAITAFVDEDNMASDSATLLPTQQSVKAYVDSQVTAQDLDVTDGSTSIDIDLDSESLGILGGTGIDSTASGTGVTLAIDSTVATLTGSQTLTNKTLSAPVVSGNLTTDGLLDGRDVAADGTKLDGIESGATADQTAAEIKTAYESNADTNAFTDTDESKLDGIEASADVTDTANVTAAGALMDSELTSEASVKALNQGVATTDSPTFAGLTTTADVSFGDNDKAIFGAGSDLQIYHDGSNSYIDDAGTGELLIRGSGVTRIQSYIGEDMIVGVTNGPANLYYDAVKKLATTSTGIDVTGTVTADSLTSQGTLGNWSIDSQGAIQTFTRASTNYIRASNASGALRFDTGGSNARLNIASNGDISFYEDTGTTPKFFWDSSAESLGIGTTSPANDVQIKTTTNGGGLTLQRDSVTEGDYSQLSFAPSTSDSADPRGWIRGHRGSSSTNTYLTFGTDNTERMRIASNGDISFSGRFLPSSTSSATSESSPKICIGYDYDTGLFQDTTNTIGFSTAGTERMRIDSSGQVGIGTSSPTYTLSVNSGSSTVPASLESTGTDSWLMLKDTNTTLGNVRLGSSSNSLIAYAGGSERMRIDASGNLLVGTTTTPSSNNEGAGFINTGASGLVQWQAGTTTTSGVSVARFYNPNGNVGSIQLSGSATSYVTSSDQRLKENIADADDAGSKVDAIQVRKFDWIADGSHQDYGMIAQELQSVAPEAVTGDADSDEMMGVDYSKLVPMLVKEIQSLRARVAQLEN